MRRLFSMDGPLPPLFLPLCGALLAIAIAKGPAQAIEAPAGTSKTYMIFIPQQDGYGVSDCMTSQSTCARVVADSWCSAKGYGKAIAWGAASDFTASIRKTSGSTATKASAKPPAGSIAISCTE
jgi:hypothetical protein